MSALSLLRTYAVYFMAHVCAFLYSICWQEAPPPRSSTLLILTRYSSSPSKLFFQCSRLSVMALLKVLTAPDVARLAKPASTLASAHRTPTQHRHKIKTQVVHAGLKLQNPLAAVRHHREEHLSTPGSD